MKKIDSKYRRRQKILRKNLEKFWGKNREQKPYISARQRANMSSSITPRFSSNNFIIDYDIDIYRKDCREELSEICQRIREFSGNHMKIFFKLGRMKISAAGMLLLYAEVYRKIEAGGTKITCNYPTDEKAEQVLQHIRFFEKIGKIERIPADEILKADKDVHSWHVLDGSTEDLKHPAKIMGFLKEITEPVSNDTNKINVAITELIANVAEHAYGENDMPKCWIIFGKAEEGQHLTIVVGDTGRTIPTTMKEHGAIKEMRARKDFTALKKIMANDSNLIKYATSMKGTRTMEAHRGKGLENAIRNIEELQGYLSIYSGEGLYKTYLPREKRRDWKNMFIQGTIVEMTIPINPD